MVRWQTALWFYGRLADQPSPWSASNPFLYRRWVALCVLTFCIAQLFLSDTEENFPIFQVAPPLAPGTNGPLRGRHPTTTPSRGGGPGWSPAVLRRHTGRLRRQPLCAPRRALPRSWRGRSHAPRGSKLRSQRGEGTPLWHVTLLRTLLRVPRSARGTTCQRPTQGPFSAPVYSSKQVQGKNPERPGGGREHSARTVLPTL